MQLLLKTFFLIFAICLSKEKLQKQLEINEKADSNLIMSQPFTL